MKVPILAIGVALACAGCTHKAVPHPAMAPSIDPPALATRPAPEPLKPTQTCVLHDKNGNPTLCLPQTPKIAFEIPLPLIDKAKAESALIDALLQNLAEMQAGILNPETDRKIKMLALKIEKESH